MFVVATVVVVPFTVKSPVTVKSLPIVTSLGKPTVIVPELSPTSTSFEVPEKVIVPPKAVLVDVVPSVTVIVLLASLSFPIDPAKSPSAIEPDLIVTAPEVTVKWFVSNEATPLLDVVASSAVIVKVLVAISVTIPSPFAMVNVSPRATVSEEASLPVMVIVEFDNELLPMFDNVLEEPLIVLFVNVSELEAVI